MGYIFEKKMQFGQVVYTGRLFRDAIRKDMSFNAYQRDMMKRNLSYKRLDMLADWNRGKAIEKAKSTNAYYRAVNWYDGIALPTMKKKGITPTQFWEWVDRGKNLLFDEVEDFEDWMEYEDEVEEEFEELYEEKG